MTENNLATLIRGVCHDVGEMKGIEFHLPATWGMQVAGRWEAGYQLRRQGNSTVILSSWFSVDMLLREEVILPWAFPPTLEQSDKFKSDIIARVDQMLKWL
ncbi:MAG TPA: hypothetical protein VG324_12580 [Blastocatellia bacterium]|nr:hypothetical protein [Blastocatellia bacterium]